MGSTPSLFPAASQEPFHDHNRFKEAQGRGWEGLASFLFGPDWFSIPLEGEDAADAAVASKEPSLAAGIKESLIKSLQSNGVTNASGPKKAPGGKTILPSRPNSTVNTAAVPKSGKGKQLINMKGNDKSVSFSLDRQQSIGADGTHPDVPGGDGDSSNNAGSAGRWHAPYLNTVPSFPLVTNTEDIANPHRLPGSKISLSLHDLATEMEACREAPTTKKPRRGNASDQDSRAAVSLKATRLKEEAADKAMRTALRIPDDVYDTMGTIWGSIQDKTEPSNNKKESDVDGNKKPATVSKTSGGGGSRKATAAASKVKFDSSSKEPPPLHNTGLSEQHKSSASGSAKMPPYVPNFLPAFPTDEYSETARDRLSASVSASVVMGDVMSRMHHREKRKSSALTLTEDEKATISDRDAVRRSMIGLGKSVGPSFWGSKWLENDSSDADKNDAKTSSNKLSTGSFLSDVTVASSSEAKKSGPNASQVAPLGRASGSRLSKILEGSMNVS